MDLISLGKEPISAESPTGQDVRYEPEFEELQGEIDKLSNPSASGSIEWEKVSKLAAEILASKGKDMLVASYLAVAQIQVAQVEGFATGLTIYRDLLENFWDKLYPKKKRMRGRMAAIEWWLEKGESAFESLKPKPLPAETLEGYRETIRQIDTILRDKVDEPPLLRPLERFVESIPVLVEKEPEPEPEPKAQQEKKEAAPQTAPAPKSAPTAPSAPAAPAEIESSADARKVLNEALRTIQKAAGFIQRENLADAAAYRWTRIAVWSEITTVPSANDGQTIIPPPDPMTKNAFNELLSHSNWQGLVESAEQQVPEYVFWLDLHRMVADGLSNMGPSYQDAHDAVCEETGRFVYRMSGIENLAFSDGTPFADGDTLQWIKGLDIGGGGGGDSTAMPGGESGDAIAEAVEAAQALLKKKKIGEAVLPFQKGIQGNASKREQMIWRLAMTQLLVGARKPKLALPHLESLLQDVDTYRLEQWDPDLALKGLKTAYLGYSAQGGEEGKEKAESLLSRIARLSPLEAVGLGK